MFIGGGRIMRTVVTVLLAVLLAVPAMAGELAGVALPETVQVSGQSLVLNGMALRRVTIIKVYVAGLYLPAKERDAQAILGSDSPRQVVMHFLRDVGAEKICDAWYEGLEANTPDYPADLKAQFDTLCGWMEDLEKGDRLVFTYLPDQGTEVVVKESQKGTLQGKAFADALFACWIGPEPGPGKKFKRSLLGE
jgi:hypothetical protein